MIIKEIRVRNFRSIVKADIELNELTLFVGLNDVGKSNVLKALNLFFNHETDPGVEFDFNKDYSKYAPHREKKAKEVIVELIIQAPSNYKGAKDIRWRCVWRWHGFHSELSRFADGTEFPSSSKLNAWLEAIRYTYVPAIRGAAYFQSLLADLHDTLAETIEAELRNAGDGFINNIRGNTNEMTGAIQDKLGLASEIRLPSDLRALFQTLDFVTTDGEHDISLGSRGDGIKTRHIPVIHEFIANQLNLNRYSGSPKINMIWGYEEPENNLEMSLAFKLAEQFIEYSQNIQVLLTTHSPGFYSLKKDEPLITTLYKVTKNPGQEAEIKEVDTEPTSLDEEMGLMPYVFPHIQDKLHEIESLRNAVETAQEQLTAQQRHVLFVEGDDEDRVFSKVIDLFGLADQLSVKREAFGCSGVREQILAWAWSINVTTYNAVGLFDRDEPGKQERGKASADEQYKRALDKGRVKVIELRVPTDLVALIQVVPNIPVELEEYLPASVWQHAQEQGWLELRSVIDLNKLITVDGADQTLNQAIEALGLSEHQERVLRHCIPDRHKDKVSRYFSNLTNEEIRTSFAYGLEFFESKISKFLIK